MVTVSALVWRWLSSRWRGTALRMLIAKGGGADAFDGGWRREFAKLIRAPDLMFPANNCMFAERAAGSSASTG